MKFKAFNSLIAGLFVGVTSSFANAQSIEDVVLNVYKEPTCGCCNGWIEHMNDNGYSTAFHHPTNIQKLKDEIAYFKYSSLISSTEIVSSFSILVRRQ